MFVRAFLKQARDMIRGNKVPLIGGSPKDKPDLPGKTGFKAPEPPKIPRHRPIPPEPRVTPTVKPLNPVKGLKGLTGAKAVHAPFANPIGDRRQ